MLFCSSRAVASLSIVYNLHMLVNKMLVLAAPTVLAALSFVLSRV